MAGGVAEAMSRMVLCQGCGFNVEPEDVREIDADAMAFGAERLACLTCRKCTEVPDLRESYRRGFNAGLDALKRVVIDTVDKSNLRKRPT